MRTRRGQAPAGIGLLTSLLGALLLATGCGPGSDLEGVGGAGDPALDPAGPAVESSRSPDQAPGAAVAMTPGLRAAYIAAREHEPGPAYDFATAADPVTASATNAYQGLMLEIDAGDLRVVSDSGEPDWSLGLRWTGIGRGNALDPVGRPPAAEISANRVGYHRADGSEQWFLNGPVGIEHGFVLPQAPIGQGAAPLVLEVTLDGELEPVLAAAGHSVSLRDPSGHERLRYSDLFASDANGVRLDTRMAAGKNIIRLVIEDGAASYPLRIDPLVWSEVMKLTASDAVDGDQLGSSVGLSADTAIVGAPYETTAPCMVSPGDCGAAYLFERNFGGPDNWGLLKKLTASDGLTSDYFGNAVAISGDTALVGAYAADVGSGDAGAVYVFDRNFGGPENWGQRKKLTASDHASFDNFGGAVAISGDTAIVGAPNEDGTGPACIPANSNCGAAYIFDRNFGGADAWGQRKELRNADAVVGDTFGKSVGVSGDTAIVGAPGQDGAATNGGAAYVFDRNLGGANNWGQRTKLTASDAQDNDELGIAVAISLDTVVVGADLEDGPVAGGSNRGAGYVFERGLGGADNWGQQQKLMASDPANADALGHAVAISGDRIILGAYLKAVGASAFAGAAYLFDRNLGGADAWGQQGKIVALDAAPNDQFGVAVAISSDTLLVGANLEDGAGLDRGAAYVFTPSAKGGPCSVAADCAGSTGFCVDGVCCEHACGNGDPNDCLACSVAAGGSKDGDCTNRDGKACTDGVFCNGADTCVKEACSLHAGDPCLANVGDADSDCSESCNEATDSCTANDPDGSSCDDGLYCTGTEHCFGGLCSVHSGDPCAGNLNGADPDCSQSCNEATNDCTANDPDGSFCDDGLYCTITQSCLGGICTGSGNPCASQIGDADMDCSEGCNEATHLCTAVEPDGTFCDDGQYCTGADRCVSGVCAGLGNPCPGPDGDGNCSETCNEAANDCSGKDPDGSACNDGVYCTGSADTCQNGICVGSGDPCASHVGDADTDCSESCDEATHTCTAPDPNGSDCDDGLYCTGVDRCIGGVCISLGDPCPGPNGDGNCSESCDEPNRTCLGPDPDDSPCDDGLTCTAVDQCQGGQCVGTGDPCAVNVGNDNDNCAESCDEATHACTAPDPDGSGCNDGVYCTATDTCHSGVCQGSGDPCAANVGDADSDCQESCNEASGNCTAPDPDGSACNDGVFCTATDTCHAGACQGSGDPCAANVGDADDNCAESCDEPSASCTAPDPDGSACSDGIFCNGPEQCQAGACTVHLGDPCAANVGDDNCVNACDEPSASCTGADGEGSLCNDGAGQCSNGTCVSGPGVTCADPSECASGYCVDDVCCLVPSCAPYRCGPGGACGEACGSTAECADGYVCNAASQCEPPAQAAPSEEGGCGCRLGPDAPQSRHLAPVGVLLGLVALRRRRAAQPGGRRVGQTR